LRGEGGGEATKGGCFSLARRAVVKVFYKLAAKPHTTTL